MLERPVRSVAPHSSVAQQELREPVPSPSQVLDHVTAGPAQITDRLLGRRRHTDRCQLTRPVQPSQASRVALVGLDPITTTFGHQRRCHHIATHPQRTQQAIQVIARRARLVTHPQPRTVLEPADQTPDRHLVMKNLVHRRFIPLRLQHRNRVRILRHVQTEMREPTMRHTGHGRLLSVCGSVHHIVDDPRTCGLRSRPFHHEYVPVRSAPAPVRGLRQTRSSTAASGEETTRLDCVTDNKEKS